MTITLPVTTGVTDDGMAFAHTGPNAQVGLYVAVRMGVNDTPEDAIAAAVVLLQFHINAGYLPTRNSRQGSND